MTTAPASRAKGGKQPGAGRPKAEPTKPVTLRLTEAQRLKFLELGGAKWVKRLIDEENQIPNVTVVRRNKVMEFWMNGELMIAVDCNESS